MKQGRTFQKIVAVAAAACVFLKTTTAKPQREADAPGTPSVLAQRSSLFAKSTPNCSEKPNCNPPLTPLSHWAGGLGAAPRSSRAEQPSGAASKAKQRKPRQSKATRSKAKRSEAEQGKARQSKAKQSNAKQSKGTRSKAKRSKAPLQKLLSNS